MNLNKIINSYINEKVNAPSFIYSIAHDKEKWMPGFTDHEHIMWNNIPIDKEIPINVIEKLNTISNIEMRASCQGESKDRPAFIIFRLKNADNIEEIVEKLKKHKDLSVGYDTGNQGKYRIGITNKKIYFGIDDKKYKKWWSDLPNKIKKAVS